MNTLVVILASLGIWACVDYLILWGWDRSWRDRRDEPPER